MTKEYLHEQQQEQNVLTSTPKFKGAEPDYRRKKNGKNQKNSYRSYQNRWLGCGTGTGNSRDILELRKGVNLMPTFNHFNWRERKAQSFDKAEIKLTKAGKTFNVYDKIQEAREDTEIYPTLEKYGCIDKMMLDHKGMYADFTNFKGLRDMKEQQIAAQNMFYELPLETRQKFNNDINQFVKDGEKYLKGLIDQDKKLEAQKLAEQKATEQAMTTPKEV